MKVFVTRKIPEVGLRLMKEAGLTVTEWLEKRNPTPQELIAVCQNNDALLDVGGAIDKPFLQACSHLKVIALFSVGYDRVDIPEATRLHIPIGNTPGVLSQSTADVAFLLMLAVSRKAFFMYEKIRKGEWGFHDTVANLGIGLYGKTLGIWGLGKIGLEMARRCAGAYKMKIIYCNRGKNKEAERELGAMPVSFDELLQQSDVLSVHTALTSETREKFNKETFAKMKNTSIFINTARGAIHNENDLAHAITNGVIWGAGLDVTNPEPMAANNPLLGLPTVAILPHIGSATTETRNAMATIAAQNIIAGLQGKRLPYVVNPEVYG